MNALPTLKSDIIAITLWITYATIHKNERRNPSHHPVFYPRSPRVLHMDGSWELSGFCWADIKDPKPNNDEKRAGCRGVFECVRAVILSALSIYLFFANYLPCSHSLSSALQSSQPNKVLSLEPRIPIPYRYARKWSASWDTSLVLSDILIHQDTSASQEHGFHKPYCTLRCP